MSHDLTALLLTCSIQKVNLSLYLFSFKMPTLSSILILLRRELVDTTHDQRFLYWDLRLTFCSWDGLTSWAPSVHDQRGVEKGGPKQLAADRSPGVWLGLFCSKVHPKTPEPFVFLMSWSLPSEETFRRLTLIVLHWNCFPGTSLSLLLRQNEV